MKAITTKYHGPTNVRGGRISATDSDGNKVSISYPHEFNSDDAHAQAALALCVKMGWGGELIGGGTKDGNVFVFADSTQRYQIPNVPAPAKLRG